MAEYDYGEFDNFTSRLRVETAYPDKVIDHRGKEFRDQQYQHNSQNNPAEPNGQKMKSVTEEPKRKRTRAKAKATTSSKQDQQLKEANNKDLKSKNIKP